MKAFDVVQFPALSDNFAVLVHDPESGATAAIDAPEAAPILAELKARNWTLTLILVTHKHADHIDGVPELKRIYDCEVIGPQVSAAQTGLYDRTVKGGDTFQWAGSEVQVFDTPGHTLDHITYWFPEQKLIFAADLIFSLGCGRLLEGDAAMMWNSIKTIRALPEESVLYCGHEYTLANGKFALTVEPDNAALKDRVAEVERLRAEGKPTLPTTIALEKATNPFLRADEPELMTAIGMAGDDPAKVFAEIRQRKDRF